VKASILLLGLSAALSAHAQGPAGAGSGAGALVSRDVDAEKNRQQKAAMDYCIAHPLDTDKCIFLPPGVSSEYPNGLRPMPKPTGPMATEEQKQTFNGTHRPPETNSPTVDPVTIPYTKPSLPEASPVIPSYSPEPVIPAPQPSYQPSCDAACLQARRQENYQAGYAVGQLIGTVIARSVVGAVDIHNKHKFCKANPTGYWNFGDGSSATCASINGEDKTRTYSASHKGLAVSSKHWSEDEKFTWSFYNTLPEDDKIYIGVFCSANPTGRALLPHAKVLAGQEPDRCLYCSPWISANAKSK
jgi:hypothetical protein